MRRLDCECPRTFRDALHSQATPIGSALPSVVGTPKLDLFDSPSSVSLLSKCCSAFNAVRTVSVWAITSAEVSVRMKSPPSVL
jgi:hypothetical protein